mgnify:CR=1 FL=1
MSILDIIPEDIPVNDPSYDLERVSKKKLCNGLELQHSGFIGEGMMGKVYSMFDRQGKKFAVKENSFDTHRVDADSLVTFKKDAYTYPTFVNMLTKGRQKYPRRIITELNKHLSKKKIEPKTKIYVSEYFLNCNYVELSSIPLKILVCNNTMHIEYICFQMMAKLKNTFGVSNNFIDVYDYFSCPHAGPVRRINQYIVMELMSTTFEKALVKAIAPRNDQALNDSVVFQCVHALGCINYYLNMTHNDFRADNILIEYNKQLIKDYDCFHYQVFDKNFYFKSSPFVIKVGDPGISNFWGPQKNGDTTGPIICSGNVFNRHLEYLYNMKPLDVDLLLLCSEGVLPLVVPDTAKEIIEYLVNIPYADVTKLNRYEMYNKFASKKMVSNASKFMNSLEQDISRKDYLRYPSINIMLKSGIFDKYTTLPSDVSKERVLTLGVITE